jgi:hypothetical protein
MAIQAAIESTLLNSPAKGMARRLTNAGCTTPRGAEWTATAVSQGDRPLRTQAIAGAARSSGRIDIWITSPEQPGLFDLTSGGKSMVPQSAMPGPRQGAIGLLDRQAGCRSGCGLEHSRRNCRPSGRRPPRSPGERSTQPPQRSFGKESGPLGIKGVYPEVAQRCVGTSGAGLARGRPDAPPYKPPQ